ncbi:MAG TPA: hypothetical protein VNR38_10475 [Ureibacillus sp.]|nr:hypothetical protein [Ureibacillus sp.]
MKILLKLYFIVSQFVYLWSLQIWIGGAILALSIIESSSNNDFVTWFILLPVISYPFLMIGCSIYAWKNHLHKPIYSAIMNLFPLFWMFGYWILSELIS